MRSRLGGIVLMAALVAVAAAQPASAGRLGRAGGLEYLKRSETLPSVVVGTVDRRARSPRCAEGDEAIGGGGIVGGKASLSGMASNSRDGKRQWLVDAWHEGQPPSTLTAYAICAPAAKVVNSSAIEAVNPGPSTGTDVAPCPAGHAVSGGALLIGARTEWWLNSTIPVDNGLDPDAVQDDAWQSYAHHRAGAPQGSVVIDVVCRKGAMPTYVQKGHTVEAGKVVTVKARCPAGTVVAGGGANIDGDSSDGKVIASAPFDTTDRKRVPEDGWMARLYNNSGGTLGATAFAVCV